MTKTEVLQFIGEKSWMSDQAGIPSMYVSDVTELLMKIDASRDSRQLSAVPSGLDELAEWVEKTFTIHNCHESGMSPSSTISAKQYLVNWIEKQQGIAR